MARLVFDVELAGTSGSDARETGSARVVDDEGRVIATGHVEATTSPGSAPGEQIELALRFVGEAV